MNKTLKVAVTPTITTVILLATAVAGGIFIWWFATSWSSVLATEFSSETGKAVGQQKSLLIVELASLRALGEVWVSNPGQVKLVITYCTIYPKGSTPSTPSFSKVAELEPDMSTPTKLTCSATGLSPSGYVVEIWALPETLFYPDEPERNAQWSVIVKYDISS